jgi:hypothetical protein
MSRAMERGGISIRLVRFIYAGEDNVKRFREIDDKFHKA